MKRKKELYLPLPSKGNWDFFKNEIWNEIGGNVIFKRIFIQNGWFHITLVSFVLPEK